MAWAVGPLVTLEIVQTKLVHYWMPSYPALILLAIGSLWTLGANRTSSSKYRWRPVTVHLVGGVVLAAMPLIPVFAFDLSWLLPLALVLSGLLLVVTAISMSTFTGYPKASLMVASIGSLLFLTLLFAPYLSRFSDSFIGTRATTLALDHIGKGHTVALYGLRDEEMLFSLPLDTDICRSREELHAAVKRDRNTVFYARERDFLKDFGTTNDGRFMVINSAEGLDLGRGRSATAVFFRLARPVLRESRRSARKDGLTGEKFGIRGDR